MEPNVGTVVYYVILGIVFAATGRWLCRTAWFVYKEWRESVIKEDFLDMLITALVTGRRV